jgi:cytochrome c oxidase subunit 4
MSALLRPFLAWLGLLLLLAAEAWIGRVLGWGNVALAIGIVMAGLVSFFFMDVGRGPGLIRVFAAAGLFWLLVLLGLGLMDPLTRHTIPAGTLADSFNGH